MRPTKARTEDVLFDRYFERGIMGNRDPVRIVGGFVKLRRYGIAGCP